ncbi:MAG: class I SAM-dependent methyltransferase [Brachymonas sp.]|nr:class I SAM-dependent methyltransferase [Brachymonas sp.]
MSNDKHPHTETANQRVNRYWNSPLCVAEYDQTHAQGIGAERDDQLWKEEFHTYLPPPPAHVLDLGCGTGFASVLLAEMGYHVTGLDQSENMLREARQKAADRKVDVTFLQGNVMAPQLPPATLAGLPNGGFDLIVARWVFWTLPDPAAAVRQACALLAPGGMLAVFDGQWFKNPECTGNKDQQHPDPHAGDKNEKNQLWAGVYTPEFLASLPLLGDEPPQALAALMQAAGFTEVRHSGMPHASAMYRQYRGTNWDEDQMYVVRGVKPRS